MTSRTPDPDFGTETQDQSRSGLESQAATSNSLRDGEPNRLFGIWRIPFYYGWIIVVAVFIAEFMTSGVGTFVTPLFFKAITDEMGWSLTLLTGALTAQTLANASIAPILGRVLDRFGARPVMLFGAIVAGIGLLLLTQIQEIWHFWLLYATVGALGLHEMGSFTGPVLITKWFVRLRGRAMALATLGTTVGGMVMAPIVGFLVSTAGWRETWRMMGIAVLVIMIPLILLFVRRQPEDMGLQPDGDKENNGQRSGAQRKAPNRYAGTEVSWTTKEAMRTKTLWLLVVGMNLVSVSANVTVIHLVPFLTLQEGVSAQAAAFIVTLRLGGSSVSRIMWGWAVDHFPMNVCLAIGFFARGLSPIMLILLPFPWNVAALVVVSIPGGGFQVLQPMAFANYFGRANAGTIQGSVRPFLTISTLAGPLFIAFLYDSTGSFDIAFLVTGAVGLVSTILALMAKPPKRKDIPSPAPTVT